MIQELLYTSHQGEGLRKGGGGGFCTVLSTEGMSPQMAAGLEKLSGYKHPFDIHDSRAAQNPVNFRHLITRIGGQTLHVLSRIADSKKEHTGRTNKLAHHLTMSDDDLPIGGPSWVVSAPGFCRTDWDGKVTLVPEVSPSRLPKDDLPVRKCSHWQKVAGDAGWAGHVAQHLLEDRSKPISIIFPLGTPTLELVNEVFSLIPHRQRWQTTFSTYFTSLPAGTTCSLRFLLDGTDEAEILKRDHRQAVVNLASKLPPLADSPLVQAARTGQINHPKPAPAPGRPARGPSRRQRAPVVTEELPDLGEEDIFDSSLDDDEEYRMAPPTQRGRKSASDFRRANRREIPEEELPASRKSGPNKMLIAGIAAAAVLMLVMVVGASAVVGGFYLAKNTEPPVDPALANPPSVNPSQTPPTTGQGTQQEPDPNFGKPSAPANSGGGPSEDGNAPKGKNGSAKEGQGKGNPPGNRKEEKGEESTSKSGEENPMSEAMPDEKEKPKGDDKPKKEEKKEEPKKPKFQPLPETLTLPPLPMSGLILTASDESGTKVKLISADQLGTPSFALHLYGLSDFKVEPFELQLDSAEDSNEYIVSLQAKNGESKPVATFSIEEGGIWFEWNKPNIELLGRQVPKVMPLIEAIRWCALSIDREGDKQRFCRLAKPKESLKKPLANKSIEQILETALPSELAMTVDPIVEPLMRHDRIRYEKVEEGTRVEFKTRIRSNKPGEDSQTKEQWVPIGMLDPRGAVGSLLRLSTNPKVTIIMNDPFLKVENYSPEEGKARAYVLQRLSFCQDRMYDKIAEDYMKEHPKENLKKGKLSDAEAQYALANLNSKDSEGTAESGWNYFAWTQYHDLVDERLEKVYRDEPFPVSWDGTKLRFQGHDFPEGVYVPMIVIRDERPSE